MAVHDQSSGGAGGTTQQMQEKAQQAASGAKEQVQGVAQQAAGGAREQAERVRGEARTRLREQLDQRSTQAGEQVRSTAQALRATSERLRDEGQDAPARAAEQIAGRVERVGDWLTGTDADSMLLEAEDFARRQPMVVAGAGLLAGFAAARFLKASSRERYEQSSSARGLPAPHDGVGSGVPASAPGVPGTVPPGSSPTAGGAARPRAGAS